MVHPQDRDYQRPSLIEEGTIPQPTSSVRTCINPDYSQSEDRTPSQDESPAIDNQPFPRRHYTPVPRLRSATWSRSTSLSSPVYHCQSPVRSGIYNDDDVNQLQGSDGSRDSSEDARDSSTGYSADRSPAGVSEDCDTSSEQDADYEHADHKRPGSERINDNLEPLHFLKYIDVDRRAHLCYVVNHEDYDVILSSVPSRDPSKSPREPHPSTPTRRCRSPASERAGPASRTEHDSPTAPDDEPTMVPVRSNQTLFDVVLNAQNVEIGSTSGRAREAGLGAPVPISVRTPSPQEESLCGGGSEAPGALLQVPGSAHEAADGGAGLSPGATVGMSTGSTLLNELPMVNSDPSADKSSADLPSVEPTADAPVAVDIEITSADCAHSGPADPSTLFDPTHKQQSNFRTLLPSASKSVLISKPGPTDDKPEPANDKPKSVNIKPKRPSAPEPEHPPPRPARGPPPQICIDWRALLSRLARRVDCVVGHVNAKGSVVYVNLDISALENLATVALSRGALDEEKGGDGTKEQNDDCRDTARGREARERFARCLEAGEVGSLVRQALYTSAVAEADNGSPASGSSLPSIPPYDITAPFQDRLAMNPMRVLREILWRYGAYSAEEDYVMTLRDDDRPPRPCIPIILEVCTRSPGQSVEEALGEARDSLTIQAAQIFSVSEAQAAASDLLRLPPASHSHQDASTGAQPQASTSARQLSPPAINPPRAGHGRPRAPLCPAQTEVILFAACEDAYTFTIATRGEDESPLRGEVKKDKGKGRAIDQGEAPRSPRRPASNKYPPPASADGMRILLGHWEQPMRSLIEAEAMEEEGVPEDVPAMGAGALPSSVPSASGSGQQGNSHGTNSTSHLSKDNNSQGEGASRSAGSQGGANAHADKGKVREQPQEGQNTATQAKDEQKLKKKASNKGKGASKEGKDAPEKAKDAPRDPKRRNAKPPPIQRSREDILSAHERWTPVRRGVPTENEVNRILAQAMKIVELSRPPSGPPPGFNIDALDFAALEEVMSAPRTTSATDARSEVAAVNSGVHSEGQAAPPNSLSNNRGEGGSRKRKRRDTAAAELASQPGPSDAAAPRRAKRRRDPSEDAASSSAKRARRAEEESGPAPPDNSTSSLMTLRERAPAQSVLPPRMQYMARQEEEDTERSARKRGREDTESDESDGDRGWTEESAARARKPAKRGRR
ncbi:hypothetical protein HDZ31DRAFT_60384 [Schizophyllum fasciatum]